MTMLRNIHWTIGICLLLFLGSVSCDDTATRKAVEKTSPTSKKEKNQKGKPRNGQHTVRYKNGEVKMVGKYKNGKRKGVWTAWYPDGSRWSETTFEEGKRSGPTTTWYKNGQMRYSGRYENDKPAGTWKYYDREGNLVREKEY